MTAAAVSEYQRSDRRHPGTRFRADIEGLRAVAVLLVMAYHAGVPAFSGGFIGVDVFFVISGFLITGLIMREVAATGRLNLVNFYVRRARRLLPAVAVVLAAVAVMTLAVIPAVRWRGIAWDVLASSTYLVNWRFATQSVDYLASEEPPSPVQHFWSLAVEEQFYLVWPALIIIALAWRRRSRWPLQRTLMIGLLVIAIPSLLWSVYLTATVPGKAYFVSTTRVWELALGAAIALAAGRLARVSRRSAVVLSWLGISLIILAAVFYDNSTAFPGYAALVPTLGAVALIIAGISRDNPGVSRVLAMGPMQSVGAMSYSLYLWHWPLLVAAAAVWGEMSTALGLLVVGISVVPAWLSYRLVESPLRRSAWVVKRWPIGVTFAAACTAVGIVAAAGLYTATPTRSPSLSAAPGAAVLSDDGVSELRDMQAELDGADAAALAARDDLPDVYRDGCHASVDASELPSCVYGDVSAERVLALVGDSHAAQWQPALDRIGELEGWRVESYTKSACGFFAVEVAHLNPPVPYDACSEWNQLLMERLTGPDAPDLVVASGSNAYSVVSNGKILERDESRPHLADGMAKAWRALREADVEVAVILNTPWVGVDVPDCISANDGRLSDCTAPKEPAVERAGDIQWIAADAAGIEILDMTDSVCPASPCAPVIGDVIVWRDGHHLTATYARTLAPNLRTLLQDHLKDAVGSV